MQQQSNPDILQTDTGFLEFAGSLLFGFGMISLIMKLLCGLLSVPWLCLPGFFPFPILEQYISSAFFSFALPLSMVILGIGLGMFNNLGWIAAQLMLLFYCCLFGYSASLLSSLWMEVGAAFGYRVACVLHLVIFFWSLFFFIYLFSSSTRRLYF
jgi:hypothetical protein